MNRFLIVAILFLASCNSKEEKKIQSNPKSFTELELAIDSLFNSEIGKNEPGAALLISYNGEMILGKGYGLRNLENKQPITANTNMRMGSVSKQFTALSALSLVDKGMLSLKDTIYNIFPFEIFKYVTIEQIINHTSGIADAEEAFYTKWDSNKIASNKDVVEWYSRNPKSHFKSGEKYQYNNGAYELLAAIVEKVSGQDFSEYVKENVFEKAKMTNTNFFNLNKPIDIKERAFCYKLDNLSNYKKVDGHFLEGLLGAGGVYTNINDYFKYDLALRNKTIFSEETHNVIFKPSSLVKPKGNANELPFLGDSEIKYAMGWFVTNNASYHGGSFLGTRTMVVREMNRPLTIAIFRNSNNTTLKLLNETYKIVNDYIKN